MKIFWRSLAILLLGAPLFASAALPFKGQTPEEIVSTIDDAVSNQTKSQDFVNELVKSLQDPDENIKVRERAAWALGQLNIKSATPALIKAAGHKGLLIRSAALDSLIRMRAGTALTTFVQIASSDPILSLRQKATIGLGLLKSDKAIDALVKLSSDPVPEVRGAAALSMAALQSKRNDFTEILKEMAADPSPYVQERAKRGLEATKSGKLALHEQLKSQDSDIRLYSAFYYHYNGNSADQKMLKDAWNVESDEDVRYELDQAIKAIKKRAAEAKARKEKADREKAAAQQKPPTKPQ